MNPTVRGTFQYHNQAAHNYGHSNVNAFLTKENIKNLGYFQMLVYSPKYLLEMHAITHTKLVTWPH